LYFAAGNKTLPFPFFPNFFFLFKFHLSFIYVLLPVFKQLVSIFLVQFEHTLQHTMLFVQHGGFLATDD
jgi:hypothetical protein